MANPHGNQSDRGMPGIEKTFELNLKSPRTQRDYLTEAAEHLKAAGWVRSGLGWGGGNHGYRHPDHPDLMVSMSPTTGSGYLINGATTTGAFLVTSRDKMRQFKRLVADFPKLLNADQAPPVLHV